MWLLNSSDIFLKFHSGIISCEFNKLKDYFELNPLCLILKSDTSIGSSIDLYKYEVLFYGVIARHVNRTPYIIFFF